MKKIIKLLVAASLIFATTTVSAFAQSLRATAETIKDDVDYALDTRYYKEANVKDFLLSTSVSNGLNVNFAKQFDKLYFGIKYSGDLFFDIKGTKNIVNNNTTTTHNIYPSNSVDMLFGINDMGIGVYLWIIPHFKDTSTQKTNSLTMETKLTWGGNYNKENFVLKPIISLGYRFDTEKKDPKAQYEFRNTVTGKLGTDFVFGDKSDLYSIFGVTYELTLPIRKTFDENDNLIKTEYGINGNYIDNAFYLSYLVNKHFNEKLDVGAKVSLNTHIKTNKTVEKEATTVENFEYRLYTNASIGAKYHCIPKVFNINIGATLNLPDLTFSKDIITNKETFETESYWGGSFNTGFEWTPFNNFTIDTNVNFYCGKQFSDTFDSLSIGLSYRK